MVDRDVVFGTVVLPMGAEDLRETHKDQELLTPRNVIRHKKGLKPEDLEDLKALAAVGDWGPLRGEFSQGHLSFAP